MLDHRCTVLGTAHCVFDSLRTLDPINLVFFNIFTKCFLVLKKESYCDLSSSFDPRSFLVLKNEEKLAFLIGCCTFCEALYFRSEFVRVKDFLF